MRVTPAPQWRPCQCGILTLVTYRADQNAPFVPMCEACVHAALVAPARTYEEDEIARLQCRNLANALWAAGFYGKLVRLYPGIGLEMLALSREAVQPSRP